MFSHSRTRANSGNNDSTIPLRPIYSPKTNGGGGGDGGAKPTNDLELSNGHDLEERSPLNPNI